MDTKSIPAPLHKTNVPLLSAAPTFQVGKVVATPGALALMDKHHIESRVIGSIAFAAVVRIVLVAAKVIYEDGGHKRILVRGKSNIGRDEGGFEYHIEQSQTHCLWLVHQLSCLFRFLLCLKFSFS
jgi:hypothetical protein